MKTQSVSIITSAISNDSKEVKLEGQLTIKNAASIKSDLLSALTSSKTVKIIFKNVIKIDLAVLQLIIALQKSAARDNKEFLLDNELTDNIKSVLLNSGLQKIFTSESKSHLNGIH